MTKVKYAVSIAVLSLLFPACTRGDTETSLSTVDIPGDTTRVSTLVESVSLPPLSSSELDVLADFLSADGSSLVEFHDALSTIAIADPDPDECSTLIDVTLPEITDSPADLIALAEQVPHDDARSIFLNEAYAAFDLLGACSDGQSVAGDEFSFQHQVSDDLLNEVDG